MASVCVLTGQYITQWMHSGDSRKKEAIAVVVVMKVLLVLVSRGVRSGGARTGHTCRV